MAHFAKVNESGIVEQVIVVGDADCAGGQYPESNPAGQAFIASLNLAGHWEQTSYNANFRGKYAGIGDTFDAEADEFVSPAAPESPAP